MAFAAAAALFCLGAPANAQNATWTGNTDTDWSTATNWNPGTTPLGTATFAASSNTAIDVTLSTTIDAITFAANSSAFVITVTGTLTIGGTGINNLASQANARFENFGTIEFTNSATAGNSTIINDCCLHFYDNSNAGTANITNNSTLSFENNSSAANATITTASFGYTYFADNANGGDARFIVESGGYLDFTSSLGPAGTGQLTAGSFEGSGYIFIGGITMTVGSNNLSTTFSGEIGDGCGCLPGNLIKVGTGTLTLSGYNTYSGFTEIRGGELHLTGTLSSSDVYVFSGAILSGDGSILNNLTINSGGIFRPNGVSVGYMSVFGDVTFNAGSRFQIALDASGGTTSLSSNGVVTINGGTIEVTAQAGTYVVGTQYTIVDALGGLAGGTFTSITDNLAFYDFNAIYDTALGYVTLEVVRNANTFNSFALTRNQIAVAGALDGANQTSALVQLLINFTPEQVRAALDLLSGEIYATTAGVFIDESRLFRSAILSRLRNMSFAGTSGPLGYLADENSTLAYSAPAQARYPFGALRPANQGYEYWAQAFGSWAKYNSDSNAAGARRNTGGFIMGLDKMLLDGVRAGLSAGYSNTQTRVADRGSKTEGDTFHLAAYLSKLDGRWSYRTGAALAAHNVDSERNALGDTVRANYFALTSQIFGEVGYGMTAGQIAFEPFANLALVHHYTNGFTETGGVTALTSNGFNNTMGFSTLGMRFATRYNLDKGQVLIPRVTLAWQHAFGELTPTATLTFQNTGTGMTIAGTPLSRDMLLTESGFEIRLSPFESVGFFHAITAANASTEHSLRGRYDWKF